MSELQATSSTNDSVASASTAVETLSPRVPSESSTKIQCPSPTAKHTKSTEHHELKRLSSTNPNPSPTTPSLAPWRHANPLTALGLSTGLVALDTSIIDVAVPKISTVFSALDDIAWYGAAYLLATTALQPVFGKFYRFWSVKRTYLGAVVVFEGEVCWCFAFEFFWGVRGRKGGGGRLLGFGRGEGFLG